MNLYNDRIVNIPQKYSTANQYKKIVTQKEDNQYFDLLLQTIMWKKDDQIFGKHIITKRKVDWFSDSDYLYTIQTQQSNHFHRLNNFLTSSKW